MSFYRYQKNIRDQQGMNESIWKEQLNTKLQEEFNFDVDLPAVFIDTFHNREKEDEVDKFSQNAQLLWSFAESKLGINYPVSAAIWLAVFRPAILVQRYPARNVRHQETHSSIW